MRPRGLAASFHYCMQPACSHSKIRSDLACEIRYVYRGFIVFLRRKNIWTIILRGQILSGSASFRVVDWRVRMKNSSPLSPFARGSIRGMAGMFDIFGTRATSRSDVLPRTTLAICIATFSVSGTTSARSSPRSGPLNQNECMSCSTSREQDQTPKRRQGRRLPTPSGRQTLQPFHITRHHGTAMILSSSQ